MSVLKSRNRIVYFRVSEDEFDKFHHLCVSTGVRSISDLARSAMQYMIEAATHDNLGGVSAKLASLETMVSDLNQKIHQLTLSLRASGPQLPRPETVSEPLVNDK